MTESYKVFATRGESDDFRDGAWRLHYPAMVARLGVPMGGPIDINLLTGRVSDTWITYQCCRAQLIEGVYLVRIGKATAALRQGAITLPDQAVRDSLPRPDLAVGDLARQEGVKRARLLLGHRQGGSQIDPGTRPHVWNRVGAVLETALPANVRTELARRRNPGTG